VIWINESELMAAIAGMWQRSSREIRYDAATRHERFYRIPSPIAVAENSAPCAHPISA